jgi:hypothetical protein
MDRSRDFAAFKHAGFLKQPVQPREVTRWGIKGRKKSPPLIGIEAESGTVRQRFLGADERAFEHEVADRSLQYIRSGLKLFLRLRREPEVKLGGSDGSFWHHVLDSAEPVGSLSWLPDNVTTKGNRLVGEKGGNVL